jgi:O-acetyl-ADP-ribose deacetylase (regulator of RNase III)
VALTPLVGPSVAVIEGRLDRDSAATYVVSVSQTTRRDGAETDWHGERVAVPHALVAQLATRKFSRTRTVAIGAIGTGLLAAITEAFVGGSGASVSGAGSGGVRSGK